MRVGRWTLFLAALPLALLAAGRAPADEKADALLKEVAAATQALHSLSAEVELMATSNGNERKIGYKVVAMRPNFLRVENSEGGAIVSDGKTLWNLLSKRRYTKAVADAQGKNLRAPNPLHGFFNPDAVAPRGYESRVAGEEKIGEVTYAVIELKRPAPANTNITSTVRLFVGPDKLIHRTVIETKTPNGESRSEYAIRNLKVDATLAEDAFAFAPPAEARLVDLQNLDANLVAVGQKAPDFNLPTLGGGTLTLSEVVKGKKATLVNFWFYS